MKETVLFLILITSIAIVLGTELSSSSLCGDDNWIAYKDEKCVKLFRTFATRDQAEEVCNQEIGIISVPTLVTIRSAAEQKFLVEYITNASEHNNVWLGAERRPGSSSEFDWNDGSPVMRYTNWGIGRPSNDIRRPCVLMQSELLGGGFSDMKWIDISCGAGSWFICQKFQTWSLRHYQEAILTARIELQNTVDSFTNQMTDVKNKINDLQENLSNNPSNIRCMYP
ncbi:hypothetical protein HA402_013717 [Bradysia odoriphaga]|nr:hypothetical protein HA402_013717 [Bradysia odoriphaga]